MITQRGDIVFFAKRIGTLVEALKQFRQVEPERKVVVVLEDADEFIGYQEREMLQLMDGENAQSGVLFLATTNYLDRFPKRMLRPGRFDHKVHVPMPEAAGRRAYLENKLKGKEDQAEIDRLVKETAGFSFGHLRELVVAAYALKHDKKTVLERLKRDRVVDPGQDRDPYASDASGDKPAPYSVKLARLEARRNPVSEGLECMLVDNVLA
jgi:SpoVK/Ycf46/Vps4 family AAA+-type ATPase